MCGTLRHEKLSVKLGTPIPIKAGDTLLNGVWDAHAREESIDKWKAGGWKEATIPSVTSYTEGYGEKQKEFSVPTGKSIKVIYHPDVKTPKGTHPFKIVTREANEVEKQTHPRFPRLVDNG